MSRRDGKTGPQLHRSDVDCDGMLAAIVKSGRLPAPPEPGKGPPCSMRATPGRLTANASTLSQFAAALSPFTNRPVVDRTGPAGVFDLDLEWTPVPGEYRGPDGGGPNVVDQPADDVPSLFTALQEHLGLKLESTKGQVDVLVIDRAEQPTAD